MQSPKPDGGDAQTDVTPQAKAEAALRTSEELHRLTLASISDTVLIADDAGKICYVCANVAVIFGYSPEEVRRLGFIAKLLGPDLFNPAQLAVKGELTNLERAITTKGGVERFLLINVKRVAIAGGTVLYSCRDVSARHRAELRVRQLNRVYAVLSNINETIVRDGDASRLFAAACRIAVEKGEFRMAWIGLRGESGTFQPVAHAGASAETLDILKQMFADPQQACAFTTQAMRTGELAVCNDIALDPRAAAWRQLALERGYRAMVSLPLRDDDALVGTFNLYASDPDFFDAREMKLLNELAADIGFALQVGRREIERRKAEAARIESEERFRQLTETIQDVFWMTDPAQNRVLYVSPAYETIWGRTQQSLYDAPHSWLDAIHAEDRARVAQATRQQADGKYDEEYRIVRPDGKVRWIRDRAFPVRDASGQIRRIVGVARDVTERRHLEEQFYQSQKMDAIGQLAGGVAHDFNNILAAILMQADLAATTPDVPPAARAGMEEICVYAERAGSLTRQLLLFSRRQVFQPTELELNETVTNLAKMLQRLIGEQVRLQLHLHPAPLLVRADAGMLDQAVLNLAVNARDAMPQGGRLLIETARKTVDAEMARLHAEAEPGTFAWLSVSDTGTGIAPEILPRIFEPFFTTKEPGKGTGLGLATVYGIVKQHRGWVQVYSEPGRGASFQIFLPLSERPELAAVEAARAKPRGGTETILVAEDEPSVRMLIRAVLERHGYRVHEAATGDDALRLWTTDRQRIALLLTDLMMPGEINGHQLARRLLADNPRLKTIFVSGYSADLAGRELILQAGENFLQKPFGPDDLLETVRRALDERP